MLLRVAGAAASRCYGARMAAAVTASDAEARPLARRLGSAFDRWWWVPAVLLGVGAAYLNRDALGMQGVYPDYLCLRAAIVAGLDPAADTCGSPTFPMWGYGWVLAVTRSELALLVGQAVLATAAAWLFLRALEQRRLLHGLPLRLVKAALVVSVPWYALNALRWPYSEAGALLLAALGVLLLAVADGPAAFRRSQWSMGHTTPAWVPEYMTEVVSLGPDGAERRELLIRPLRT